MNGCAIGALLCGLAGHARYLSGVLRQTVEHEMAQEARVLRQYDEARTAIKRWIEMPDQDADRIIGSLKQENWRSSNRPRKALPQIFEERGAFSAHPAHLVHAVRSARPHPPVPGPTPCRRRPAPPPPTPPRRCAPACRSLLRMARNLYP